MAEQKAQITLPAGMSVEQFTALFEKFKVQREQNGVKSKARSKAVSDLIKKYQSEFDVLMKKYLGT